MHATRDATGILASLGLTQTEAATYLALLDGGPATGYEVAKRMSIARANAYSALEALAQLRLVEREPGVPTRFAPVVPAAVIGRLAAAHAARLDELEMAFERLAARRDPEPPVFERIEGHAAQRAAVERIAARARKQVTARMPAPGLKAFEPFGRGLRRRGVEVDVAPRPSDVLGYILVDGRWAAIWHPEGTGFWGDEALLIAIVRELLAA